MRTKKSITKEYDRLCGQLDEQMDSSDLGELVGTLQALEFVLEISAGSRTKKKSK